MNTKTKKKRRKKKKASGFKINFDRLKHKYKTLSKKKKKAVNAVIIILCVALIAGLCAVAVAIHNGKVENFKFNTDKDYVSGIDVSSHNGDIDWETVADNVDFAFIRVGYSGYSNGSLSTDNKARYNLKHANKANVPIGVYFYSQATTKDEAVKEAEYTLEIIKHYDISLPVVIDFEYAYEKDGSLGGRLKGANLTKYQAAEIINAFCDTVSDAGYKPGVYANTHFYESKIDVKSLKSGITIWVADYNKSNTYNGKFDIWQYSNTGKCDGINSKYVDKNYWYI